MPLLCLDVGSTWTKGALVAPDGTLLGTAQHATTPPEVLDGVAAVTDALDARAAEVLACSSAGGGLRLAVVGQERLVSAEAGYRVALSAGAKVVHVSSGDLDGAGIRALRADRPDVILLVGGTDGGDQRVLLHNARRLGANRIAVPIVLAGNVEAQSEALESLAGRKVVATANVLPDVGELAPGPARAAIRSVFLSHVIGGKGLSRGPRFRSLVRTVTPDAVLTGVSRLAGVLARDEEEGAVLVVDVGGATTDVYSAVSTVDGERAATVALPADRRTVEGDIGMRWSAPGIVAEALAERLITAPEDLGAAAKHRAADVDFIPTTAEESEVDIRLAALAAILAVRRHLRLVEGNLGPKGAGLLVLSGGVFRHASADALAQVEATLRADPIVRPVLRTARVVVDRSYVLAPAGLLADAGHGDVADRLLEGSI
ncbi:Protein mutL [Alloactinosynnema sp. L-07]|uniref:glutamate mutase L n=1 Tax=Alloactinosynnema sp. L-07 TaxID=1653480 RepID=UPI00065F0B6A|nr:glutamate mutase L [Alloactinosynnema sp. L-07]CRK59715.1 Protein mutL [Alloactinosynnema sp. L-07]